MVRKAMEEMGEDRVMWSVDYPYESNEDAANWFDAVEGLGDETKKEDRVEKRREIFQPDDGSRRLLDYIQGHSFIM